MGLEHSLVSQLYCGLEVDGVSLEIGAVAAAHHRAVGTIAEKITDRLHRDLRGHLSMGVAPHPVSDHIQATLAVDAKRILVVQTRHTRIAEAMGKHQSHTKWCRSSCLPNLLELSQFVLQSTVCAPPT